MATESNPTVAATSRPKLVPVQTSQAGRIAHANSTASSHSVSLKVNQAQYAEAESVLTEEIPIQHGFTHPAARNSPNRFSLWARKKKQ